MATFIAEAIFWCTGIAFVILVYQLAVLPGIRLSIRYKTFALRDALRTLVINGELSESSKEFRLLHSSLNYMCVSLSKYDLARLLHNVSTMDEETRSQIRAATKVIEESSERVQAIYKESLKICFQALIFNSLFFFVVSTVSFGLYLFIKVGVQHLREAFKRRVKQDTQVGFLAPELAAA